MTEDDAKTKICCGPQMLATTIMLAAPKGGVELLENAGRCIGADCMAWRPRNATRTQRTGYCGLAGAPQ